MQTATNRQRWSQLLVALGGFGVLVGVIELTGAPRGLLLPIWTGVMLALAAGTGSANCLPRLRKGVRS